MLQDFCIFDAKAEAYIEPFKCHAVGQAIRSFMDIIANPQSVIAKHPEDFVLFHLGSWDQFTGSYTSFTTPKPIATALSLISRLQSEQSGGSFSEEVKDA
jgi:hypothetical protein